MDAGFASSDEVGGSLSSSPDLLSSVLTSFSRKGFTNTWQGNVHETTVGHSLIQGDLQIFTNGEQGSSPNWDLESAWISVSVICTFFFFFFLAEGKRRDFVRPH